MSGIQQANARSLSTPSAAVDTQADLAVAVGTRIEAGLAAVAAASEVETAVDRKP